MGFPKGVAWLPALAFLHACGSEARLQAEPARLLVFSKTTGFRHASIPAGVAMVRDLGAKNGFEVAATEDPAVFTDAGLEPYAAVVFLCTTGDVLAGEQEAALERYIRAGGGWIGIHSAADTEYDWPFYEILVSAYFLRHPAVQVASIDVEDANHPSALGLPSRWTRTDEWYDFRRNPRPDVRVLLRLDETSYSGGSMGADHPISWCREVEAGRSWYTALGHTQGSYAEPEFQAHVLGGIAWAGRLSPPTADSPRTWLFLLPLLLVGLCRLAATGVPQSGVTLPATAFRQRVRGTDNPSGGPRPQE